MMKKSAVLTAAGLALVTATAFAAVTFDPNTGLGWVGKGDVQTVFGLNNSRMQAVHQGVTFEYDETTTYEWVCEWTTGEGTRGEKTHTKAHTRTTGLQGVVGSDSRKTGQWTGWHLIGFTSGGSGEGDFQPTCDGNPEGGGKSGEKVVVEGSVIATPNGGGLYVVHPAHGRHLLQ